MVRARDVTRSVFRRFLPGCAIAFFSVVLGIAIVDQPLHPFATPIVGCMVLGLTAGFGLTVSRGVRWLRSRRVTLSRTLWCGLLSPLAYWAVATALPRAPRWETVLGSIIGSAGFAAVTGVLAGTLLGLLAFFRNTESPEPESAVGEPLEIGSGDPIEAWAARATDGGEGVRVDSTSRQRRQSEPRAESHAA